ncbi:hypothetical protein MMC07_004947 [Pseudocyphellaria aurata]|nr:hypothetical protein [Pseudocyphellaria aurata]
MASEPLSKRLKSSAPLIGTHSGHFHADEALAVYLLRLLPKYHSSSLLRTRDPDLLSTCDTVVDVGGEYSPQTNRYDHHQRTFNATFPSRPTKLSSAGLVFLHFGKEIIARHTKLPAESETVTLLWEKLYTGFVEALDAQDNGISVYDPAKTKDLEKRFHDGGVSLGSLVGDLNDVYSDEEDTSSSASKNPDQAQAAEDLRFLVASNLMGQVFLRKLNKYHRSWLPARTEIAQAYSRLASLTPPLNQILVLDRSLPWKDHLSTLESAQESQPPVLYVLYSESEAHDAKWRVQAVAVSADSFESRKPLPEPWRGLRDDVLSEAAGLDGCIFVHASGFIGGNKTKHGALEMAQKAVEF